MRHIPVALVMELLSVCVASTGARAGETLEGALKVEQAVRANVLPFSPSYVSPACLLPYPVCKLAFATVSLVGGWEQLALGGDLNGAEDALARGLGGSWFVRPENVSGNWFWSLPEPLPLIGYFATGRSNGGNVPLELAPTTKAAETGGDVLPP